MINNEPEPQPTPCRKPRDPAAPSSASQRPLDIVHEPHRRLNPLTGDWIIVSPQRTARPWQGQDTPMAPTETAPYDPACYLCPGNNRAGGETNPGYESTFVFENDFAALLSDEPGKVEVHQNPLIQVEAARGDCRVMCFSPRHDLTLSKMTHDQLRVVINLWQDQFDELNEQWEWVQTFETRGLISGSSNPHPHGQIWSSSFIPNEALVEIASQEKYLKEHSTTMLLDYAAYEVSAGERTVALNEHWIVVVPFWAYWPFETILLPRRPLATLGEMTSEQASGLEPILSTLLGAYDRLFDTPFPYCSGWHNAPRSGSPGVQLHSHYYPPLLRSAEVAKIPASYEFLANAQRDLTAESAARSLRLHC